MTQRPRGKDFVREIVERDLAEGRHQRVITRFPPEPNGYLHIGHAKSIVLNFGIAEDYGARAPHGARCHLRFDDTNPTTEDVRYVESIQEDVRWLGFDWGEHLYFASDYFERLWELAEGLIRDGKAYVDSQDEETIREGRGTVTEPGTESPYRSRSAEENLDLFRRMRAGEFPDGTHVLRARIDMGHPNMLMRDPILYRIRHAHHYRTGDAWCVYPMYDYAHALEDALEDVTHSLCTLEFENNRELYDWVVENTGVESRPRQYEFARLNLDFTVMSKRKLLRLVEDGDVDGWDDPRMPTIAGLRRRGVTPSAIRAFCEMVGVSRADSQVDVGKLEHAIRDDLNRAAPRVLCVLRPLRVTLTNYPGGDAPDIPAETPGGGIEEGVEWLDAPYFPRDVGREGSRELPFSRTLYIDRDDFMQDPPEDFYRLAPGGEVRLRYGYVIRCHEAVKDESGRLTELLCTYDPRTRGGRTPDGRKVRGTIHWVSAEHSLPCRVRLYDRLFRVPDPDAAAGPGGDFRDFLNPDSLSVEEDARIEPSVARDPPGTRYQFERVGYFWPDPVETGPDSPVFNRIVPLRDTWARRRREAEAEQSRAEVAAQAAAPTSSGRRGRTGARGEKRAARRPASARKGEAAEGPSPSPGPSEPEPRRRPNATRTPDLEALTRSLLEEFGLRKEEARVLTRDPETAALFSEALAAITGSDAGRKGQAAPGGLSDPATAARAVTNWMVNELPREQGDRPTGDLPFGGRELARLVALVEEGTISSSGGREVLATLASSGGDPATIVETRGLAQLSDPDALAPEVDRILEDLPDKVAEYRQGKTGLLGFFVGQIMRRTGGRADPEQVKSLLRSRLGEEG